MGNQDTQATQATEEKPETTAPAGGEGALEDAENSLLRSQQQETESPPEAAEPDPKDARITELEAQVNDLKSVVNQQTATNLALQDQHNQALGAVQKQLTDSLAAAASRYREVVLQVHTDLPPSLIEGGTIDQVEASIVKAKTIVEHVRNTLTEQAAAQIPGGAPVRGGPDVESMSPIDKIKYSLATRKK